MIRQIEIYRGTGTDPYRNLALEQYLLERTAPGTVGLYLWQNQQTVVIGRNQNPWRECDTERLEKDGGKLARRLSGGGAVFHDLGNVNFTFLACKADDDLAQQQAVVVEACRSVGIAAEVSGRNDLLAGGRKFSGCAFYEHNGRRCHHGTLLVDVDREKMARYLRPSREKLGSKGVASVRARVVNLRELCPALTAADMLKRMETAFEAVFGLRAVRLDGSGFDWGYVDRLAGRNRSWEWNFGRNLRLSQMCGRRFDWGEVTVSFSVREGRLAQVSVCTDAMDWRVAPELERVLTGCRLRREELCAAVEAADLAEQEKRDVCRLLEKV